ncbi:glycosyltransferase family 2 protein [Candidatus Fermentibacterales bacterium]|nr:glycosyltransferase family 2 protein [Candidatus Fermentibacterales bacterium]
MEPKSISVVVPVYNEEQNAAAAVRSLDAVLSRGFKDFEIVIVESGSTDGTAAIADELARSNERIRVLHQNRREGLGSAIRLGFASALKDYVLYVDGDEPFDVADIATRVLPLLGDFRAVIGYRIGKRESFRRKLYSWTYNRLVQLLFRLDVRDVNFSMKVIERKLLQSLELTSNGCFYDAELIAELRRRGIEIKQIGFEYVPRGRGRSSLDRPSVILGILREMLSYLLRRGSGSRRIDAVPPGPSAS